MLDCFSHVRLFVTPRTVACQAPLSMGFSRQEYWSRLPCPPPGDLPDTGIKPLSSASPALAGGFFTTSATWRPNPWVGACTPALFPFGLLPADPYSTPAFMLDRISQTSNYKPLLLSQTVGLSIDCGYPVGRDLSRKAWGLRMVTLREQSCVFTAPANTKLKVKIAARYLVNLSSSVYYLFFSELIYI